MSLSRQRMTAVLRKLAAVADKPAADKPAPAMLPGPGGQPIPSLRPGVVPLPHQQSAVNKLFQNKGRLVLTAPPGSGKTLTAVLGFEAMKRDGRARSALVIVPSGLRTNFATEGVDKFTTSKYQVIGGNDERKMNPNVVLRDAVKSGKDYTIVGYEVFRSDPEGIIRRSGADTLILDEFHKARNESTQLYGALQRARALTTNFIGLTASPVNNDVSELASLLSLSEGHRLMTAQQFKRSFERNVGFSPGFNGGKKPKKELQNIPEMLQMVYPKIDFITYDDVRGDKVMPKKQVSNVEVPMSQEQWDLYQLALNKVGPVKERIMRGDPNVSIRDANVLFSQIAQARQVANSVGMGRKDITPAQSAERTPKAKKLLDDTVEHLAQDPKNQVVLYSNLVNGGVDVLLAGLKARGIEPAVFIGKGAEVGGDTVTSSEREAGLAEYKAGKKRVIVLSGAGAEGLDLRNSTAFFALDGHFNPERIIQAEARARRLGGQEFREPDKRVVDVRRYQSTPPPQAQPGMFARMFSKAPPKQFTTDQWMYRVAGEKYGKTEKLYAALREPYKYISRYKDASGEWKYVYPKEGGGVDVLSAPKPPPTSVLSPKSWF
jgi:hypothetical protein